MYYYDQMAYFTKLNKISAIMKTMEFSVKTRLIASQMAAYLGTLFHVQRFYPGTMWDNNG